jgi:hypothetical protein
MEGDLIVHPGDTVMAGYDFTILGQHPAATVNFDKGTVVLNVSCSDGSTQPLTVNLSDASYTVSGQLDSCDSRGWGGSGSAVSDDNGAGDDTHNNGNDVSHGNNNSHNGSASGGNQAGNGASASAVPDDNGAGDDIHNTGNDGAGWGGQSTDGGTWYPSDSHGSYSTYQGWVTVPSTICGGKHAYISSAVFNANVSSSDAQDPVVVRFHYRDRSEGQWSSTATLNPSGMGCEPDAKLVLRANSSGAPGSSVGAGVLQVTNPGPDPMLISSVQITSSDATLLSGLTLQAVQGALNQSASAGPASPSTFNFSPALSVPAGATVTLTLNAAISSAASANSTTTETVSTITAIDANTLEAQAVNGLPITLGTVGVSIVAVPTTASISLINLGSGSGLAGSTVPAGSFSVTNNGPDDVRIGAIELTSSNPALFSGLTLEGSVGGVIETAGGLSTSPTTFSFIPALSLPAGSSATFVLAATISTSPGSSTPSTQTVTVISAIDTSNGNTVNVATLPITVGTVNLITPTTAAISLVSQVSDSGLAGMTVKSGTFAVTNNGPDPVTLSSVQVTSSNSQLLTSLSLTATAGATSTTVTSTPGSPSTFSFSPALSLAAGASATFNLSVILAGNPAVTTPTTEAVTAVTLADTTNAQTVAITGLPVTVGTVTLATPTTASVSLAAMGDNSGAAGVAVGAGSFTVYNNGPDSITVNSVQIGSSNIALLSGMTIQGTSGAASQILMLGASSPQTFSFSPGLSVAPGQSATFTLAVTIASNPASASASTETVTAVGLTDNTYGQAVVASGLPLATGTVSLITPTTATATLVTQVGTSGNAGSAVAAGSFAVNNAGPDAISVSSIQITSTNPAILAGLKLTGSVGATTVTASAGSSAADTFIFMPGLTIPADSSATYSLTATLSTSGAAGLSTEAVSMVNAVDTSNNQAIGIDTVPITIGTVTLLVPTPTPSPSPTPAVQATPSPTASGPTPTPSPPPTPSPIPTTSPVPTPTPQPTGVVASLVAFAKNGGTGGATVRAGSFQITNYSASPVSLSALQISSGNLGLLSSLTIQANLSGATTMVETATIGSGDPVTFTFNPALPVAAGASVNFSLDATLAQTPLVTSDTPESVSAVTAADSNQAAVTVSGLPLQVGDVSYIAPPAATPAGAAQASSVSLGQYTASANGSTSVGTFQILNTGNDPVTINSIQITSSTPSMLSSLTLSDLTNGTGGAAVTATPITGTDTFVLNPPVTMNPGDPAETYSLTATLASGVSGVDSTIEMAGAINAIDATTNESISVSGVAVLIGTISLPPTTCTAPTVYPFVALKSQMWYPRSAGSALLLSGGALSGQVLVAGGAWSNDIFADPQNLTATADLFNPATNLFSPVGGTTVNPPASALMSITRQLQAAVALPNGEALEIGGIDWTASSQVSMDTFLPSLNGNTGGFQAAPALPVTIASETATVLQNGQVLIAGGSDAGPSPDPLNVAEIYDPTTSSYTAVLTMTDYRSQHTATLLNDGTVLLTGGFDQNGVTNSAEIYDPSTQSFTAVGNMAVARFAHSAALLPDGRVLVAGGFDNNYDSVSTAEIYDPTTRTFSLTGSMQASRGDFTATTLPTGDVLVTGGDWQVGNVYVDGSAGAELYNECMGGFVSAGAMVESRAFHTASLIPLANSQWEVLLAGGANADDALLDGPNTQNPQDNSAGIPFVVGCLDNTGCPSGEIYSPVTPVQ